MKIKIGVVTNQFKNESSQFAHENLTYTMQGNVSALSDAGALPILIPITQVEDVQAYINQVDGILLPGGQDIQPSLYGEPNSALLGPTWPLRDAFEWQLIKLAIAQQKPILAICRGAQLLNVYFGGTLYQDESLISSDSPVEHDQTRIPIKNELPSHTIKILDERLRETLGDTTGVNSLHHQAIKKLGQNLIPTAIADDGVVEGFRSTNYPIVAYQWHPEMQQRSDSRMANLFKIFLEENF